MGTCRVCLHVRLCFVFSSKLLWDGQETDYAKLLAIKKMLKLMQWAES